MGYTKTLVNITARPMSVDFPLNKANLTLIPLIAGTETVAFFGGGAWVL